MPAGRVDHELLDLVRARQVEPGQRGRGQERRHRRRYAPVSSMFSTSFSPAPLVRAGRVGDEQGDRRAAERALEVDAVRAAGLLDVDVARRRSGSGRRARSGSSPRSPKPSVAVWTTPPSRRRAPSDEPVSRTRLRDPVAISVVLAARGRAAVDLVARRARHRVPGEVDAPFAVTVAYASGEASVSPRPS